MTSDIYLDGLDRFRSQFKVLQDDLMCQKTQVNTLTKKLVEKHRVIEMYLELFAEMNKELRRYSEVAIGLYQALELVAPKLPSEDGKMVREKLTEVKGFASRQLVPKTLAQSQQAQARKRALSKEETSEVKANSEMDSKKPRQEDNQTSLSEQPLSLP